MIPFCSIKSQITKLIYPVGSIYMSANNTNPSELFGGTWVAWGSGKIPVGVDTGDSDFNTVEKTGGNKTHSHSQGVTGAATGNTGSTTLNTNQIPSHNHRIKRIQLGTVGDSVTVVTTWDRSDFRDDTNVTSSIGGGQGHTHSLNNHTHTNPNTNASSSLQPYITCYMWKRTG